MGNHLRRQSDLNSWIAYLSKWNSSCIMESTEVEVTGLGAASGILPVCAYSGLVGFGLLGMVERMNC